MKREDHMILAHLDKDEPVTGKIDSLGKQTKSKLKKLGVQEPKPDNGFFTIPEKRMDVFYPIGMSEKDKPEYEKKVREKHLKPILIQ